MLTVLFAFALAQAPNGQALFENTCATCHTAAGDARTPAMAALRQRSPEDIVTALTTGAMREQGADLQAAERRAIAEFLAGRPIGSAAGGAGHTLRGRASRSPGALSLVCSACADRRSLRAMHEHGRRKRGTAACASPRSSRCAGPSPRSPRGAHLVR